MRFTSGLSLLAALVLTQFAACSSGGSSGGATAGGATDGATDGGTSSGGGDNPPAPSPFKAACDLYAKALCAREAACGSDSAITNDDEQRLRAGAWAFGQGTKVCEDALSASCQQDHALAGITETPQDVENCAQQTTTSCTTPTPRCAKKGTLADGAACTKATQCLSGVCAFESSRTSGFDACGKCKTVNYGDTAFNWTQCLGVGSDLYYYSGGAKCDRMKQENEPCLATNVCVDGLVCSGNVCVKAPEENEPCKSRECGLGLACNAAETCVKPVLLGEGAACSTGDVERCRSGLSCNTAFDDAGVRSGTNTCQSPRYVPEGESCDSVTPCAWPFECDRTTSKCGPATTTVCK